MPPHAPGGNEFKAQDSDPETSALKDYPPRKELGDKRLNIILFPLDITETHLLEESRWEAASKPSVEQGSPLASWMSAWIGGTFKKMKSLHPEAKEMVMQLHDPTCVWYAFDYENNAGKWEVKRNVDLRVETAGQWSRGACIIDRRTRGKMDEVLPDDGRLNAVDGDEGGWLSKVRGNRLGWCVGSPGGQVLEDLIVETILTS